MGLRYLAIFDADPTPSLDHDLQTADHPFGVVRVRSLDIEERDTFSLAALRNEVIPIDEILDKELGDVEVVAGPHTITQKDGLRGTRIVYTVQGAHELLHRRPDWPRRPRHQHGLLLHRRLRRRLLRRQPERRSPRSPIPGPSRTRDFADSTQGSRDMSPTGTPPGLAWPAPDTGPTPPPEYKGERRGAAHPQADVDLGPVEVPDRPGPGVVRPVLGHGDRQPDHPGGRRLQPGDRRTAGGCCC